MKIKFMVAATLMAALVTTTSCGNSIKRAQRSGFHTNRFGIITAHQEYFCSSVLAGMCADSFDSHLLVGQ